MKGIVVMKGIIIELLSPMEKGILHTILDKHGIEEIDAFVRFWDGTKIQIDGDLSPIEIKALASFIEMMEVLEIIEDMSEQGDET